MTTQPIVRRCKPLLGTFVEITLQGDGQYSDLLHQSEMLFAEIGAIEQRMSFFNPDSELSQINRKAFYEPVPISPQMQQLLQFCIRLYLASGGIFDITIAPTLVQHKKLPGLPIAVDAQGSSADIELGDGWVKFHRKVLLDLGGVAKGFAIDQAFNQCDPDCRVLINAGGDLRASHWQSESIELRMPHDPLRYISVPLKRSAMATSAGYFQSGTSAIVDPNFRAPVVMNDSISVFAHSCMQADALTKVVCLHTEPSQLLQSFQAEAIAVDRFGDIHNY
jgi:thiamine biosynthesis lipoprotein